MITAIVIPSVDNCGIICVVGGEAMSRRADDAIGTTGIGNSQMLCKTHNRAKGNR